MEFNALIDITVYSVKIQYVQLFRDHLVLFEREDGLPRVTTYHLPAVGEPLESLQGGRSVDFIDPVYSVKPSESQFDSCILRFSYSSMRTPPSVYDYDMNTGISVLKKIETVRLPKQMLFITDSFDFLLHHDFPWMCIYFSVYIPTLLGFGLIKG